MCLAKQNGPDSVTAAKDTAARVVRAAVESAAPRKSGQLKSRVRIFEGLDRRALTGSIRRRLLIGPEKRKGFYGCSSTWARVSEAGASPGLDG